MEVHDSKRLSNFLLNRKWRNCLRLKQFVSGTRVAFRTGAETGLRLVAEADHDPHSPQTLSLIGNQPASISQTAAAGWGTISATVTRGGTAM